MEVKEAQEMVDQYISSFKEGYFPAYTNLVRLMEEVGEFSKEFNHQFGPLKKSSKAAENRLEEEIGDIYFSLCVLANQLDIDLSVALKKVIEKYVARDRQRWTPKGENKT